MGKLYREKAGLIIVDVQEKLMKIVERSCEVTHRIQQVVKGCQIIGLPIVVTEQYPQGLGETVAPIKACLNQDQEFFSKTTFSCLEDQGIQNKILSLPVSQWVVVGVEAHICVLQTARDLLEANKEVVVLNDAISSRSIFDYSTAIAEMRDCGSRISSTETILFELLKDSKSPEFKPVSQLFQCGC